MNNSQLIQVLSTFSKPELSKLRKFVSSPYFNRRQDVIRFLDWIIEKSPIKRGHLREEQAFRQVYPKDEFSASTFRYLSSFLLQLTKKYLAFEHIDKDHRQTQLALCCELRERNIDNVFNRELKTFLKEQEKRSIRDTNHYHYNYLAFSEHYAFQAKNNRTGTTKIQEMNDELSIYFSVELLKQGCKMLIHKTVVDQNYQSTLLNHVLSTLEKHPPELPIIAIYYHSYRALEDPKNELHFRQLHQLLTDQWSTFTNKEIKEILIIAINYCIRQLNNGKRQYIEEAFELYRWGLEKNIFTKDDYLSEYDYKNILRLAVGLEEYQWANDFLDRFKKHLAPEKRENIYQYNLAFLRFRQKDYRGAMPMLQQVNLEDIYSNMDARRMLIRTYYELSEFDALDTLLDSFKVFIHRQKNIGYHRENYLNLIKIMKRMLRSNLDQENTRAQIIHRIKSLDQIAESAWLLQQLGEK